MDTEDIENFKVGSVIVQLVGDGDRIVESVRGGRPFEPETLEWFGWNVNRGDGVLDIGAYSGLFSIAAAKRGARVVAIEPMPVMCARLRQNRTLNGVSFRIEKAVATDTVGHGTITYNQNVPFTAGASMARKNGTKLPAKFITVDSLALPAVSVIKIDVERHEAAVLRGARETLAKHRPKMIVEALDEKLRLEALAAAPGYRCERILDVRNMLLVPND